VSAVEFVPDDEMAGAAGLGVLHALGQQAGTLINAAAFVVVVFLLAWFGLRPATAALTGRGAGGGGEETRALPQPLDPQAAAALTDGSEGDRDPAALQMAPVEDFRQRIKPPPQER